MIHFAFLRFHSLSLHHRHCTKAMLHTDIHGNCTPHFVYAFLKFYASFIVKHLPYVMVLLPVQMVSLFSASTTSLRQSSSTFQILHYSM